MNARVINPPVLQYGKTSKQANIVSNWILCRQSQPHSLPQTPRDGAWNMIDKTFVKPASVDRWFVIIYERIQRFNEGAAREMVGSLIQACRAVGQS